MKAFPICIYLFLFLFILSPQSFAEGSVTINEFLANPANGQNEWVEIYNPTAADVNLTGWILNDKSDSKKKLDSLGSILSGGFAVYEYTGDGWLNNTASSSKSESINLLDDKGNSVDIYLYTVNQKENVTTGRYPDGSGDWVVLEKATKGEPNSGPLPTPTPTPLPSPTSIPTSKPTSTKSPTKTASTPTKTASSPTPTQKILSSSPSQGQALSKATSTKVNIPTSVLGQSTKSAAATPSAGATSSNKEVKTLGSNQNNIFKILIGAGGLFIIACAILLFRHFKNKKINNE